MAADSQPVDRLVGRAGADVGAPALKASHADRDAVVDRLQTAAGEGRLTVEELDERVEAALTARTVDELVPLTADLPPSGAPTGIPTGVADFAAPATPGDTVLIEQKGSQIARRGAWTVPQRLELRAEWCKVVLDLTEARITYPTLHIDLDMRGGSLVLITDPGIEVDSDQVRFTFGGLKERGRRRSGRTGRFRREEVPTRLRIHVTGELHLGKILVHQQRRVRGA
ncbi:DUF1707 SHOCT-like domain-containing protein [Streptacidiphilus fuscans]|uniref:DUF1707 domain-containing protein n=1 Tax=Streptacidiphilus fuscans TaxID=2789292 RepID=A0A931FCC0_9ACTN|nr:DUF1707 domain-containing protein [Streptacidiphilus fuscans]MBF9069572.1 DUF1707 domain-containing protein [Streptacidiphilus fuscans]